MWKMRNEVALADVERHCVSCGRKLWLIAISDEDAGAPVPKDVKCGACAQEDPPETNCLEELRRVSDARGNRLFRLRRTVVAIKTLYERIKKERGDLTDSLDLEWSLGVLDGLRRAIHMLEVADPTDKYAPLDHSKAVIRKCVVCGKRLMITPPKEDVELPTPAKVLCSSCSYLKDEAWRKDATS